MIRTARSIFLCVKVDKIWMGGHVERVGEKRGVYRGLVGKREGKSPLGRPRRRWVYNIKMDLQEMGCGVMDCYRAGSG